MASWPVLSVTVFLPLLGALFIATMRAEDEAVKRNARWVALWTTLIVFAVSLVQVWRFDPSSAEFQFVEKRPWLGGTINYTVGVDGISLPFVILTTALMPICILASWKPIQWRVKEYMIAFLVLETMMVGTFSALDTVVFYLFFEGGLIPMFLIIGVWGGPQPGLRDVQVLPLHAARLGLDAARDHRALPRGGHDRHSDDAPP